MTLQRRHYEFLAENIRHDNKLSENQRQLIASVLGEWFRVVANFNMPRWYKACGISEEVAEEVLFHATGYTYEVPSTGRNKTTES